MVSKNNYAERMEETSNRQSHFGIRKLTIGAVSVLLGTTLWMSTSANVTHADVKDGNDKSTDENHSQNVDSTTPKKAVVEVNNQTNANNQAIQKSTSQTDQNTSKQNVDQNQKVNNTTKTPSNKQAAANVDTTQKVENAAAKTTNSAQKQNLNQTNKQANDTALQIQKQKAAKAEQNTTNQTDTNNDINNKITKSATRDALNTADTSKQAANIEEKAQSSKNISNTKNDISKAGQSGITEKSELSPAELNILKAIVAKNDQTNKQADLSKYSAAQLKKLFNASFVKDDSSSDTPVDLNTFTPDFHYSQNPNALYNGQLQYSIAKDGATNSTFNYTTDIDDPGKNLYFYKNGKLQATLSDTGVTLGNGSVPDSKHTSVEHWTFSIGKIDVVPDSVYKGGNYNLDVRIVGVDNYTYFRFKYIDTKTNKIYYGGEVKASSGHGKFNALAMDGIPAYYNSKGNWPAQGSPVIGTTDQTITYINADTGEIMKQFTSKNASSGSNYNITDAALNKINFDGKIYDRVIPENVKSTGEDLYNQTYTSSNISSAAINKVITTNNGIEIKAGDIWDEPLTGSVSSSRKGDITMSSTDYGFRLVYITQQTDSKGTVDINTYVVDTGDLPASGNRKVAKAVLMRGESDIKSSPNMDGLSGLDLPSKAPFGGTYGLGKERTLNAIGVNGAHDGHQDFVFFYRAPSTPTPPTPTDTYHAETESKVIHRTINYYDKVTGQPIPADVIRKAGSNVTNPTLGDVTFTRSKVYDQDNKFVGYGTVVDGKYVPTSTKFADGWTTQSNTLGEVISPNLTSQYYTAPTGGLDATASSTENGSEVPSWTVMPTDSNRVYNIYYGHQTEPINKTETVKRIFHYIFTDSDVEGKPGNGSDKTYSKAPQTVTFKETGTKDLLTGQEDVTWTPESGTLAQFIPQEIPGYKLKYVYNDGESTPVKDGAVEVTVTPNSQNHSATFIYDPDPTIQKARVTIVDMDEHNKELTHFTNYNGEAGEPIKFTVNNSNIDGSQQALTSYLNSGYVFVKAVEGNVIQDATTAAQITGTSISSGSGKNVTVSYGDFWNKPEIQYFTIYLKHGKSEHVEKGTTTSTVHYLVEGNSENKPKAPEDNVQTVNWTKTDTTDLVTGETTYGDWTTDIKQYKDVPTPPIKDYTPSLDNVPGEKTEYGKNPYTIVTYTPNTPSEVTAQKATIEVIDKTENKVLGTFNNDDGVAGTQITFQGLDPTVQAYINSGYVFNSAFNVTDGEPGTSIQDGKDSWKLPDFDDIKDNVQKFKIYLVHGTKEEKIPSTAQVHYIMSDGTKAPADSPKQTITFTNTVDAVTGEVEKSVPDKTSFTPVNSPKVSGYTPSQETVTFSAPIAGQDQLVNVIYTPESQALQHANLKIVDKTENKVLVSGLTDQGDAGTQIVFPSEQSIVETFLNNGYKFDSAINDETNSSIGTSADSIKFPVFDNDPEKSQDFTIYLVHATAPVNPDNPGAGYTKADLEKTVNRIINYVDENGTKIADSINSNVVFIGQGVRDKVTNKLVNLDKNGNIVNEDGKLTWTYKVDGGSSEDGNTYTFPATQKRPTIDYNSITYNYNHVDNATYDGGDGSVKEYTVTAPNDVNNLTVNVVYNPVQEGTTYHYGKNPEEKTVTRTINYYDKVTGEPIPASLIKDNPVVQNATITRQIVLDNKGNVVGYGKISEDGKTFTPNDSWTTDDKSWSEVVSPDLTKYGYTAPDVKEVAHVTVDSSTKDQTINVYYGHETIPVTPDNPENPNVPINPDDPDGPKYPEGLTKQDLEETVTRTIHYVGVNSDGTTTPVDGAPDGKSDYVQTATFTKHAIVDKVTGKILGYDINNDDKVDIEDSSRAWIPYSTEFKAVDSKSPASVLDKEGKPFNSVDIPVVPATSVLPTSKFSDITVTYRNTGTTPTVTYKGTKEEKEVVRNITYMDSVTNTAIPENLAKPQTQTVNLIRYRINDSNGNFIGYGTVSEDGKSYTINPNNPAGWNTGEWTEVTSPNLENYGYTAPDIKIVPKVTVTGATENSKVIVYYGHETIPVEPNNPKTPTDPINPQDPNGPKYPDGVDKNQLNKTITRTINYVNTNGDKVDGAPDGKDTYKQEVTFTRTAIVDKVTGKLLGYDTNNDGKADLGVNEGDRAWTPVSSTFDAVKSKAPKEVGYDSVNIPTVGAEVVTPADNDSVVTVVYSKNETPPTPTQENQSAQLTIIDRNDPKNLITLNTYDANGKSDTPISFSGSQAYVNQLITMGYKLDGFVSDTGQESNPKTYSEIKFGNYDNDSKVEQKFILYLVHTTTEVTPNKPGHPGDPVNPDNPDGPKYPAGTSESDVVENATQTITYHYSDNSRPDTTKIITKDKAFTRTITFDNVTGKIITTTDWTPNNTTFEKVPTPVVQDYHANKKEAGGLTATPQDPNVKDEVIYYPNGKIVPVDPEGNHIPGTNTPSFPTDPDDPTKVDTGIVPNVPNTWTPENPNEKPGDPVDPNPNDPSKNVEVPFKPVTPTPTTDKGSITVTVYDVTDNKDLPEYGKSSGSEDVGTKFTYDKATTITDLENQGYRVINPNVTIPNEIAKGNQTVTIYVEHGTTPVNPDNPGKPGEPINPNDPDGPKWPDNTGEDSLTKTITRTIDYINNTGKTIASPVVQTVKFTESGTLDKVTGKWITPLTWNKTSEEVPSQVSPTIKGYHVVSVSRDADGNNVGAATIKNTDSSYKVIVTYAPNGTTVKNNQTIPSSQIVKFVDESGKEIYQQNKQTYTFVYSGDTIDETTGAIIDQGKWNEQTHTYDTVSVPVIDGYVAISGYINQDGKFVAGGLTATHENPDVVATVVYAKIGKIVPVDPEGKDIPDAPTPNYKNDPNDPTKVVPNEPVPSIPGYTPNVPNITPDNPTKDTPVPYTPNVNDQGQVIVIVHDNTTNTDIPQYGYDSGEQKVGDKVDYDKTKVITNLENQGYKVINPDVTIPGEITKGTQKVTIYVEHGLIPVTPDNPGQPGQPINPNDPDGPKWPDDTGKDALIKTGTQIIHYEGAGSQTPKDNVETTEFNHDMVIDKVTGKIVKDNGWTPSDHKFGTVATPVIEGYHADKGIAGGLTVTPDKLKAEETVTYMPNGHIVPVDPEGNKIPNAPTPQYPTNPDNPTKVTPNEPVPSIPGYTPEVPTVTPKNPGKDTTVIYTPIPKDKGQIIVVVHDNTTNTDIPKYGYDSGEQKVGDKIDYDKTKVITDLENQGYKVINPDVTIPSEITKGSQKVVIYVEHGTTPVNPDNPGKPGQPINPNDPDGPKWPDNTGKDNISKDITRTITFVNSEGKEVHAPVEQTVHFTAHGVIDNVTGKWITPLTWSPAQTVDSQNVPFVQNYHVTTISKDGNDNNTEVKAVTITHDETSYKVVVTYEPNGHIVPVDPEGNKIPNAPTPQYPTNPDNPTKVTPNEPVPSIPGYTPEVPTVTPKNPGKDTTVIYTPNPKDKGQIIIIVHDNTTNTDIPKYGYDSGEQKVGDKVDYDKTKVITDLENQGYKVINPDVTIPGKITKGPQKITIYVEHDLVPVNPDNPGKPGQPINPNDPNGPKWPEDTGKDALTKTGTQTITYQGAGSQTPKESVTTVSFEHHLVIDKVTGKIVKDNGWTPASQTYQKITSPTIAGYTPNQSVVGGDTVKATESNINRHYTVTYTKDETPVTPVTPTPEPSVTTVIGKQTITFIDGDNNTPLKEADVQTHTFTITNGVPDQNSYTFGKITVPVIKGYVAEVKTAGGKTVTPQDPDASVVVIYHKIGKIVPVDPDHNPIPGADTPQYENDPNDPTKVEPNEPVPSIDGYTPSQSTVTPDNPTKNTEVVYTKKTTPDEPDEPNEPDDTSDEPENPKPPKKHHENNKPKPSTPKNNYNYNNAPHSQSGYWNNVGPHGQWSNNVAPHGQSVNGWNNNIGPHGEHVDANGDIISASGTIIGYIDKNGKAHYTKTLPKTGSNQNQSEIATAIGLTAAGLTMLGLAGVKKRRKR